ncbi:MAG: hypothetical protein OEW17_05885 [Gemmatimonadota bacterium]|nr:hypothetical protein [Gemmatimonadota bacterium]
MIQGPAVVVQDIPPMPPMPDIPVPPMLPPWMVLPAEVTALIALGFFGACALVLYPLMRAIARRIEGRTQAADPALKGEVEELRARLGEMEGLQFRVADLEERLDFAERMLAQHRGGERLKPGEG